MKECYGGRRTEEIVSSMPAGRVLRGDNWVQSKPISVPGHESTCFIRGKYDTLFELDDGTYGVIDFKTSRVSREHLGKYSRQLHAYAYALEDPAPGEFGLGPISTLGLLVYEPERFAHETDQDALLSGALAWVEVPRDDEMFIGFLSEVLDVLALPEAPVPGESCAYCAYREESREWGL
jgi:hypothetical protein